MKRAKVFKIEDDSQDSQEIETSELVKEASTSNLYSTPLEIPNIHVIFSDLLPLVLSGVETADLVRFRLVSKFWKTCCNRLLIKRNDHKLTFKSNRQQHKNKFILKQRRRRETVTENNQEQDESESEEEDEENSNSSNSENEKKVVKGTDFSLSLFLSHFSATSFPCVRFGFIGRQFHAEDVKVFFSKYAGRIKHLSLEWGGRENNLWVNGGREFPEKWTTHQTLAELLILNKLAHLETLHVSGYFSLTGTDTGNKALDFAATQNSLPSLKVLHFEYCDSKETRLVIKTLLSTGAAPNIRTISLPKTVSPQEILPFFTPKEIQLFSFPGFFMRLFSSLLSIKMLQQIDQLCPRTKTGTGGLEFLSLQFHQPPKNCQMAEGTLQIFQSLLLKSRESLKSLEIPFAGFIFMMNALDFDFGSDPEFRAFPFKNVRHLHFDSWNEPLDQILPLEYFPLRNQIAASLSLSNSFPCLETVAIHCLYDKMEEWFPFAHEKLETVKRLDIAIAMIRRRAPKSYSIKFLKMFPNLERMRLWGLFDFPHFAPCVWQMKRLKSLDLNIIIGTEAVENLFPNLDCAFTGFSHKIVHMILSGNSDLKAKHEPELESLRELGGNPSILDLKELRTFKLNFTDRYYGVSSYNFITRVTRDYAFKLMKRVQIKIIITPPEDHSSWDKSLFAPTCLDNVTVKLGQP